MSEGIEVRLLDDYRTCRNLHFAEFLAARASSHRWIHSHDLAEEFQVPRHCLLVNDRLRKHYEDAKVAQSPDDFFNPAG
ncbi:MAG: hypothetical protein WD314_09785 [Trueperaceae bacterium]